MKQSIIAAVTALFCTFGAFCAPSGSLLKVKDVNVNVSEGILTVKMTIDPHSVRPGIDREVRFTPVVRAIGAADSLELPVVTIAGKNRYILAERAGFIDAGERIYRSGKGNDIEYRAEVAAQPWMDRCRIDVREQTANCCDPISPLAETPVAELDLRAVPAAPAYRYIALTADSTVELEAEGRAFVDFVVNRTELRPTYRNNRREIAKILESIDFVRNDSDATITRVTFKGYASPEGPWDNNVRLAMGRTNTLKEYVRDLYNFSPDIMHSDYEPEDWDGLRRWVEQCTLPNRQGIMEVINSDLAPDPKDHELRRRFPADYAVILDSVYPALRHSDYTIRYSIRTYVDIEELKRVFASAPERLRPVDFYRIASTYPEGSDDYDNVMLTAVRYYPNDTQVNINAANIAMRHGDLEAARRYAAKAGGSADAEYTRAVLAAQTGDDNTAMQLLERAASLGCEAAADELQRVNALRAGRKVKYLINITE